MAQARVGSSRDEIGRQGWGAGRWLGSSASLAAHLGLFLSVASVLTLANVAFSPERLWFWRPLAVWGGLLALHLVAVAARFLFAEDPAGGAPAAAPVPPRARFGGVAMAGSDRSAAAVPAGQRLAGPVLRAGSGLRTVIGRQAARAGAAGASTPRRARALVQRLSARKTTDGVPAGAPPSAVAPPAPPAQTSFAASWPSGWPAPSGPPPAGDPTPAAPAPGAEEEIPAAVAALWASGRAAAPAPSRAEPAVAPPPAAATRAEPAADVVLHGPAMEGTPAAASEPDWGSLEREATAWLSRRQADLTPPAAAERSAATGD